MKYRIENAYNIGALMDLVNILIKDGRYCRSLHSDA